MENNFFNVGVDFYDSEMFPLRRAVLDNNINEVRQLLDFGVDVNQMTKQKTSALGNAVFRNYGNIVKLLLERGANPNEGDPDMFPLTRAINNESLEIIKMLLNANADMYSEDEYIGESPEQYIRTTRFKHDKEMRKLFNKFMSNDEILMNAKNNMTSFMQAIGDKHKNYLVSNKGPSLPANITRIVGKIISGSSKPTLAMQTNNIRIRGSPSASPPSRRRRTQRKTRRKR